MQHEYLFMCPYCWQPISMLLDLSVNEQSYIEDCEICCQPIQITYRADEEEILYFDAIRMQ